MGTKKTGGIISIFWGIFAWIVGILFIAGGIYNFFNPMYNQNNPPIFGLDYNIAIGIGGIILGVLLIRSWFKQFMAKNKHITKQSSELGTAASTLFPNR